jgi:LAO/AO transport system kinase
MLGGVDDLQTRFLAGNERALARAITLIESGAAAGQELLRGLRAAGRVGEGRVVGITGSPGSGKSTLTDRLIEAWRDRGKRVAVVAVDPSSPFSGGAILGDRIRMTRWHADPDVFVRSMATRGHLGGLAAATLQVVTLLSSARFDAVFVETVGVGQSEIDIVRVADSTVLVLTPGHGDGVQAFKAGVMEIADLFCVNKFDLPGGPRLQREIQAALHLAPLPDGAWPPPVTSAIATRGEGIDDLVAGLDAHHAYLEESGALAGVERRRVHFELTASISEAVRRALTGREEGLIDAVLAGSTTPAEAVAALLAGSAGPAAERGA